MKPEVLRCWQKTESDWDVIIGFCVLALPDIIVIINAVIVIIINLL